MSIRRGMWVAAAALTSALPLVVPATSQAQRWSGAKPMSVKLLPPWSEADQPLRYVLNQPGYVAAFIITPGEGVRLIYPLTYEEKLQWAGFHTDYLTGLRFDDDIYDAVTGASAYRFAGLGFPWAQGPRYLYIVASRFPLDVSRFVHRPAELQRTVGLKNARSFDADDAVFGLLNNVVSLGSDDSWDTDVYMLWAPPWIDDGPNSFEEALQWGVRTRVVACRDGTSRVLPANWMFAGCPGEGQLLPARGAVSTTKRLASDVDSPTVLPTIRGIRTKSMPPAKTEPTVSGFFTTAAGGVTSNGVRLVDRTDEPLRTSAYSTTSGIPVVIIERGESLREREEGGRDGWHNPRRAYPIDDGAPHLAPAPRLAPNPELPPNPQLPPNPHMAPAPRTAPAPNIGESRMTSAPMPRAEPRMEAPRMATPAPTPTPAAAPASSERPSQTGKVQ